MPIAHFNPRERHNSALFMERQRWYLTPNQDFGMAQALQGRRFPPVPRRTAGLNLD
jgi:hypothetical protein